MSGPRLRRNLPRFLYPLALVGAVLAALLAYLTRPRRFPGAAPESVAVQVTEPVEAAISNVDGLERLQSTTAEGVSLVVAEFDFGADTEEKEREIADALERIGLPAGAEAPSVNRIDF